MKVHNIYFLSLNLLLIKKEEGVKRNFYVVTPKKYLVETDQEGGGESYEYYDYDPEDMKTLLRLNDIAESTGHLSEKQKKQVIHLLNKNPHIYRVMLEKNAPSGGPDASGMQNKGILTGFESLIFNNLQSLN